MGGGGADGGDGSDSDGDGSGRAAAAQHARGQYMCAHVRGQASNMRRCAREAREGERACNESSLTSCSGRGERGIEPRIGRADRHPAPSLLFVDATHRKHTTLNVLIMR